MLPLLILTRGAIVRAVLAGGSHDQYVDCIMSMQLITDGLGLGLRS